MKTPKAYYPLIAATVIIAGGLIPMSFGDERLQIQTIENQQVRSPVKVETDPIKRHLNDEVMQPLVQQATIRSSFSRRVPTESMSYELVETTDEASQNERTFTVLQKVTPIFSKQKEAKSTEFVKLRHLKSSDQLQVDLKGQWIALDEHPILKALPKFKPANTITP